MSFVAVAITGSNALQQIQAGKYAAGQSELQAQQLQYQGSIERQNALETARLIRRAGNYQVGQANAAYAGAGVQVGEGSAALTERTITENYQHDAFQAILEGNRRARGLDTQASFDRIDGRMKQAAGYVNAAGTALGGVYNAMRANGWRTAGPGFSGTQAPAPVTDRSSYSPLTRIN